MLLYGRLFEARLRAANESLAGNFSRALIQQEVDRFSFTQRKDFQVITYYT